MASKTTSLPTGFLDGPAPNLQKSTVDWRAGGLSEYDEYWAVVLDGVLSEEECDTLLKLAESNTEVGWERALINIGGGRQALCEPVRKCGRIIWDTPELATKLWARIAAAVPEIHRLENQPHITGMRPVKAYRMTRLNERMRFLKYIGGEYFHAHGDASYITLDGKEISFLTLHLYLNGMAGKPGPESLIGGSTRFFGADMIRKIDVAPKAGRVLLFQHRNLLHSGEEVIKGTKYTMRTDIMYTNEEIEKEDDKP
ncbi:oxidoreductase domain-containing protein [Delitschia confertaspora ATCC 74209]|uniref:Oxidoreductase domain-containing protein n=1 Tax=Delitschia confertaspora ATCC 74209 TaxID=1513339 RepID=A0A9P4MXL3_9PLEO|nr:oxidoreductase domain-containing protein [Delitschia confertaspora ATCC 74209]